MVRYETPDLIDLNESAVGYGATCATFGSNASFGCNPTGNRAATGCIAGSSAGNWCDTGASGNPRPLT